MTLPIAQLGQPVLRQATREVAPEEIQSPEFRHFLQEMRDTLVAAKGAGLAAPQVYDSRRVFLAAILPPVEAEGEPQIETLINPRLIGASEERMQAWEGCLSFPELLVQVSRPIAVRVEYLDAEGHPCVADLVDFPARVIQHEYDHLEGILTIDRVKSSRDIIKASEMEAVLEKERKKEAPPEDS